MEVQWIICRRCWMVFARNKDICSCGNVNYEDYRSFVENCDVISDSIALTRQLADHSKPDMTKSYYDFEGIDSKKNAGFLSLVSQKIQEESRDPSVIEENERGSISVDQFDSNQSDEDSLTKNTFEALLAESSWLDDFDYCQDISEFAANLSLNTPAFSNELKDSTPHIGKPFDTLAFKSSGRESGRSLLEEAADQAASSTILQNSESVHYFKDIPDVSANLHSVASASSNELIDSLSHIGKHFDDLVSPSSARTEWNPVETGTGQTSSTILLQDSENFHYFKDIPDLPANISSGTSASSSEFTNMIPNIENPFDSIASDSSGRVEWGLLEATIEADSSTILQDSENYYFKNMPDAPANLFSAAPEPSNEFTSSIPNIGNLIDSLESESLAWNEWSNLEKGYGPIGSPTIGYELHCADISNDIIEAANATNQHVNNGKDINRLEQHQTAYNEAILDNAVQNWESNQFFTFLPEKSPENFNFNEINPVHNSILHPNTPGGVSNLDTWNAYQVSNDYQVFLSNPGVTSVNNEFDEFRTNISETVKCPVLFGHPHGYNTRGLNLSLTQNIAARPYSSLEGSLDIHNNILTKTQFTNNIMTVGIAGVSQRSTVSDFWQTTTRNSCPYNSRENNFLLNQCEKVFPFQSHHKAHPQVYTKERLFGCNESHERFTVQWLPKDHLGAHTDESSICSTKCNSGFIQKSNLDRDQLPKQTEKKPHCEKGFSYLYNLTRHEITHDSETPFICDVCGKSFSSKRNLQSHYYKHFTYRSFSCDVCGKSFKSKSDLSKHKFIHEPKKPFICDVCGKGFAQKGNRDRHLQTHRFYF